MSMDKDKANQLKARLLGPFRTQVRRPVSEVTEALSDVGIVHTCLEAQRRIGDFCDRDFDYGDSRLKLRLTKDFRDIFIKVYCPDIVGEGYVPSPARHLLDKTLDILGDYLT